MSAAVSRRAVLESAAIGGAVGSMAAAGIAQATSADPHPPELPAPRDQHVEWLAEYFRRRNIYDDTSREIDDEKRYWQEMDRFRVLVEHTPALSFQGVVCQLVLLLDWCMSCELPIEQIRPPIELAVRWLGITTWRESA